MAHAPQDYALTLLGAPIHPELARLFGYEGARRFVAFRWEPTGDEIIYDDAVVSGDGDWQAWLLWTGHQAVWKYLQSWDFGASDHPARDALLVDRMAQAGYAGPTDLVRRFLLEAPDLVAERAAFASTSEEEQRRKEQEALEAARRELNRIDRLQEDPEALEDYVREQMRQQQQRLGRLETWLDEQVSYS